MKSTTKMNNTIFESATLSQGFEKTQIVMPTFATTLTPIAKFNELLQSKGITRVVEEYETTQWNERPSWSYKVTIVYFGNKFEGQSVSFKKQEAKHKACTKLFENMEKFTENTIEEIDPEVEELLIIGGVEQNPGPTVKIPRVLATITEYNDFNELHTKYGLRVRFLKHQHSADDSYVYIKVTDEQVEQIQHAMDNKLSVRILATVTLDSLQNVYSNHTNFNPELRIIIKPDKNLLSNLSLDFPLGESEGKFWKVGNFNFLPRNLLRVKIGTKWWTSEVISSVKYRHCIHSVEKQQMTKAQLIHYSSLVTTVQMFYTRVENKYGPMMKLFSDLFFTNVDLLKKQNRIDVSHEEAWELLKEVNVVVIPSERVVYGSHLELTGVSEPHSTEVPNYYKLNDLRPELNLEQPYEDLLIMYRDGLLRDKEVINRELKFDFAALSEATKIPMQLRSEHENLSKEESFVKKLVLTRLLRTNFEEAMYESLKTVDDEDLGRYMLKFLSKRIYAYSTTATLQRMLFAEIKKNPEDIDLLHSSHILFKTFPQEYKIARRMQLEYQVFCREFGFESRKNVFNSVDNVKRLFKIRYSKVEFINDSYFDRMKKCYSDLKDFLATSFETKKTMKEINDLWDKKKDSIRTLLDNDASSKLIRTTDFSSFQNSLASAKNIANTLFNEALSKILSFVGIPFENTFPATTALLYYLIWKNTDNTTLQYMLLLDILGTIGILDVALAALRTVGSMLSAVWHKVFPTVDDEDIDALISTLQEDTSQNFKNAETNLGDDFLDADKQTEDLSIWEKVLHAVNSNNTALIGLVAIGLGTAFKLKAKDYSYNIIGKNIVETMKNLSIVGGGLVMVPRVYQMILSCFKWIVDELKGKIIKDHITKYELNRQATDWMKRIAPFISEKVIRVFPKSPELCMTWLSLEKEHAFLLSRSLDMDKEVRIEFTKYAKVFLSRSEKVHIALSNMFPQDELFHVQFCSPPGYGKTDLAHAVIAELTKAHEIGTIKQAQTMEGPVEKALVSNAILQTSPIKEVYAYNENLKYMDGYVGQLVLYADDVNVFTNTEPEKIIQQLYICSGNTVLANMADLSEKGRPIESKIMISNTNVPFPKPQNMTEPSALWRRRILIKVDPVPELAKLLGVATKAGKSDSDPSTTDMTGSSVVEIISNYCKEKKLNRSQCEHLSFTFLVPDDNGSIVVTKRINGKELKLEGLNFKQLKKILANMLIKHMSTEWERASQKDPIMSKLKLYYKAMVDSKLDEYKDSNIDVVKEGAKIVKDYYEKVLKGNIEALKEKVRGMKINKEEKEAYEKQFKLMDRFYEKKKQTEEAFYTDYSDSFGVDNLFRQDVSAKVTQHKLETAVVDGVEYAYMTPSTETNAYMMEGADWREISKIDVKLLGGKSISTYGYKLSQPISNDHEYGVVLGALLELDSVTSFHKDNYLADKINKAKEFPERVAFMEAIKRHITGLADVTARAGKWLYNKIIEYVGKPLLNGVFVMLSLLGLFFTASIVGTLLAPGNVAYNQSPQRTIFPGVKKEGVRPVSQNTDLARATSRSCFKAQVNESSFQLLAYSGNIFVAPNHGLSKVTYPARIKIADPTTTELIKEFDLLQSQVKHIPDSDYALISIPEFRPTKSLRRKWITENELRDDMMLLRHVNGTVISIREKQRNLKTFEGERDIVVQENHVLYNPVDPRAYGSHKGRVLAMDCQTVHGDSGSVVMHHNDSLPSSILGIVHQSNICMQTTYVAILSREDIDKVMKQFEFRDKIDVCLHDVEEISDHPKKRIFKHNQIVKASPWRNQSVDTSLGFKRTPLFNEFPSEVQPAGQVETDPRFPPGSRHFLEKSLNKSAGVVYVKMNTEEKKFAKSYLKAIYLNWIPKVWTARNLTTAQAITGIRMPGSTSIDVTTSAGLPYKEERGVIGKTPMIRYNAEGKFWQIQERVYHEVEFYEDRYIAGKIPQNYKLEFRKHELVGENKILEPKTRTVGVGNFIQQIVYMKLFKDFFTFVKNVWMEGGSSPFAMGLNPEVHWHKVATHLKYHDYVIDFDVKAWEEKMSQYLMNMSTEVRLQILKESAQAAGRTWDTDFERIAYGLVVDYIHSDVVFEDLMYVKSSGLLSGHPGTFMENSEVHEMIFGVVCYKILKKYAPHYATIDFIIEHCRSVKAADDIIIAISPLARQFVTVDRLVAGYNMIGYEITAPDKTPTVSAKTLEEVQFLKNGFYSNNGYYTVLPNLSQVNQLLAWVRTGTSLTTEDQMITNFGTAMRFAFHRGRDEYELVRSKLNASCAAKHMKFVWNADYDMMSMVVSKNHEDDMNKFWSLSSSERDDALFSQETVYLK